MSDMSFFVLRNQLHLLRYKRILSFAVNPVKIMADLVELFTKIGLSEDRVKNTVKNEQLSQKLKQATLEVISKP